MAERGYARMSMDAVAARAGVSKPTIYLRFPGKAELATAALAAYRGRGAVRLRGDTRADLIAHLRDFRRRVERPFGMVMLGTVLAEERETPELMMRFRERVVAPRRAELRAVLEAARARGEVRPAADLDAAVHMLVGSYYAQHLAGAPFGRDWPEAQVDIVLAGLAAAPT